MDVSGITDPTGLFNANGLVVVITGGGSGLGHAFAATLVRNGAAKVFLLGRRLQVLEQVAKDLNAKVVIPIQCDVADASSVSAAVKTISSQTKYIDVLVNNAGVNGPKHTKLQQAETVEEIAQMMLSEQDLWPQTYAINTTAVVTVAASFLPLLNEGNLRRGWPDGKRTQQKREKVPEGFDENDERTSQIITVASISGFNREVTAGLAYTASKAGAVLLAKSMANFLAPFGIRSNVIAPGRFPSEMTAGGETIFPINKIPHGTQGRFENMAACILSLVGKGGSYYNGDIRVIDGGRLSVMPATY
ncbi:NAD(P)-binding protein [Myriangium duriaei CBS 260.36]|uniref:NAD(P)-binding protein n=1 Tax=Myriangium duriaei CBS 260.36 TaxID=1168546 RepID=A0A9P4MEK9_9PEZI|nr:NAD(P)-binding protein [Myriangium duriaei CBS 260.36]